MLYHYQLLLCILSVDKHYNNKQLYKLFKCFDVFDHLDDKSTPLNSAKVAFKLNAY